MALLQVNTFSQALSRIITFHIILPNDAPPEMLAGNSNYDRPMKTLYLLHGFSGSTQDWLTGSNETISLCASYNCDIYFRPPLNNHVCSKYIKIQSIIF